MNKRKGFTIIAQRLDKFMIFRDWNENAGAHETIILPFIGSKHYLMYFLFRLVEPPRGSPFKFENMWLRDNKIVDLIRGWWSEANIGNPSNNFKINKKLKYVKTMLKK